MTVQTYCFLIITDFIREKNNLCCDPVVIDLSVLKKLGNFGFQLCPVGIYHLRRTFFYTGNLLVQAIQFFQKIFLQVVSLLGTGLNEFLTGFPHRRLQYAPQFFFIYGLFFHSKDIRVSGEGADFYVIVQVKVLLDLLQAGYIFGCQLFVVFQSAVVYGIVFVCDINVYLTSLDISFHQISDGSFQKAEFLWHFDTQIQISVVNGFEFDGYFSFISYDF